MYLSIKNLSVNGLNAQIKRHRVDEWIKKQKHSICCLQNTHFRAKDTYILKDSGRDNKFNVNGQDRNAGVAILITENYTLK